ncbi:hypothetical protein NKH19_23105, partial [Mesorhizobium sp. M1338]
METTMSIRDQIASLGTDPAFGLHRATDRADGGRRTPILNLSFFPRRGALFRQERPVVERDGMLILRDDERMKLRPSETVEN